MISKVSCTFKFSCLIAHVCEVKHQHYCSIGHKNTNLETEAKSIKSNDIRHKGNSRERNSKQRLAKI